MKQLQEHAKNAQKEARDYLERFKIEKTVGDMLNALIHARDEKPLVFMVTWILLSVRLSTYLAFVRMQICRLRRYRLEATFP